MTIKLLGYNGLLRVNKIWQMTLHLNVLKIVIDRKVGNQERVSIAKSAGEEKN